MPHVEILLKQLEEANRRAADQQHALNVSAIIAVTDRHGVITEANEHFCRISGYSASELLGETHRKVNSGVHSSEFFGEMWHTISRGKVWKGEVCNRAKDGSLYWVDTTIVPFCRKGEDPYQYIAIRQDITSRKRAEENLRIERERLFLAEKMASLGMLSTGISHELGNPLGALRGRLEMLEIQASKGADLSPKAVDAAVAKMLALVDRMAKIIRGLRSYARDGRDDPMESVNLGDILTDILEISKDRCHKNNVQIRVSDFDSDLMTLGRDAEIAQVIVNLFNNAVDAVKGEGDAGIDISLEERGERLVMKICNNGPMIPDDVVLKMFDPFFTTKPVGEGTGLGLSICRSIVEAHKGELTVTSHDHRTCFQVILPKASPANTSF